MSRIGLTTITLTDKTSIQMDKTTISVKGPKGELSLSYPSVLSVTQEENTLKVRRKKETKLAKSLHGTYQRLIENMVVGVTDGYKKNLELVGTGYRVAKQGNKIVLSLGFSHPIEYTPPANITLAVEGNNKITVEGIDKQLVGQVAATIRAYRSPEPYKGKGVRYENEIVRRKAGKAAKAGA